MSVEEAQHLKAVGAGILTGLAIPTAWLIEIDFILRIVLTITGILTGVYSFLYYKRRADKEK